MDKGKRIEELRTQVEQAKTRAVQENSNMLKLFHPDLTNKEALIGGQMLLDKMMESSKKAREMTESLDSCETMEEIEAWRQANKI